MNIDDQKKKLTPAQYNTCFLKGTEPPGSGKWLHNKETNMSTRVVCGSELFNSKTKDEPSLIRANGRITRYEGA